MSTPESRGRDAILTKLRNIAAAPETLFRSRGDTRAKPETVPSAVTDAAGSGLALGKTFGENLTQVLGSYEIVASRSEVAQRVFARIEGWKEQNEVTGSLNSEVLSWAPSAMPIEGLVQQLERHGLSIFVPRNMSNEDERSHAAKLSVGLTGVDAAFAGTGSMVLVPGPGKSRAASLLPLHHIALVPVSKIYPTMESWLAKLRANGTLAALFRVHAQLAFITGPSKSADIELNLTLGVHGPRDVHAIVFDDER